jgi:hypothetical protein
MSPFSSEEFARRVIRNVQIIIISLAVGPIVFAGIAVLHRANQPPQHGSLLPYLAAGFGITALAARIFIGKSTVANQRDRIAAGTWSHGSNAPRANLPANMTNGDRLLFVFQQKTIIESAIVEGAAFFNIISYLITGQWWSLAVAGVLVLVNLFPFPANDRVENWVRYQLEFMELEKR